MSTNVLSAHLRGKRHSFFSPYSILQLFVLIFFAVVCASNAQTAGDSGTSSTGEKQPAPKSQAAASTNSAQEDLDTILQKAAAQPSAPLEGSGWKSLFDGKSLAGWQVTDFAAHGQVHCEHGLMLIEMGDALSGVNWTNRDLPTNNYEIALDAMKITGSDFFCGLTFPVGDSWASLILGGWGGTVVGISSLDGNDASENETTKYIKFDTNRWYRIRVRVTEKKLEAWLDQDKIVDVKTTGKQVTLRFGEIELSKPLGVATYQTTSAVREIKLRRLEGGK